MNFQNNWHFQHSFICSKNLILAIQTCSLDTFNRFWSPEYSSPISYISLRIIHFSKITDILDKFPDFVDFQSPPESVDGGWHWRYTIFELQICFYWWPKNFMSKWHHEWLMPKNCWGGEIILIFPPPPRVEMSDYKECDAACMHFLWKKQQICVKFRQL